MKNKKIFVNPGENNCPADALMSDFRKNASSNYPKNTIFSQSGIEFFKKMANQYIVAENGNELTFYWKAIPEEKLPPLKVKIRRFKGKYFLNYLKEYGKKEKTLIRGKRRKGKYKNGTVEIIKMKNNSEKNKDVYDGGR